MQKGENIPVIHIHVNTPPADLEKWFIFYFFHVLAFHGGGSINIYVVHGGGSINIYVVGVLFGGSNFSLSGCSHVGSLFTDEKQKKGWLVM